MVNYNTKNLTSVTGKCISGNAIVSETAKSPVTHTEQERDNESELTPVTGEA